GGDRLLRDRAREHRERPARHRRARASMGRRRHRCAASLRLSRHRRPVPCVRRHVRGLERHAAARAERVARRRAARARRKRHDLRETRRRRSATPRRAARAPARARLRGARALSHRCGPRAASSAIPAARLMGAFRGTPRRRPWGSGAHILVRTRPRKAPISHAAGIAARVVPRGLASGPWRALDDRPKIAARSKSCSNVRLARALLSSIMLAAPSAAAFAQDSPSLNGYVTLANGYWNRGLSQNDGLSVQLGIDYQQKTGWFVGAWAANVDYAVEKNWPEPRKIESEIYGGYHKRSGNWSWTALLGRYFYPSTAVSYDWNELSATVGWRDRIYYTAGYTDQYYGIWRSSLSQELSFSQPLRGNFEIGGTLGHVEIEATPIDYTHWN